jgi:predicted AlkP superfamily phosphohydrolase/phosphomutase
MVSEHGMWVSLTSGVSRAEHGYHYFRQLVPGTYDLAPVRGRDLGVKPFWEWLPADRPVMVVDVPDIAAPRPRAGLQISDWATHDPQVPPSTEPAGLLQEVERIFGPQAVIHEKPGGTLADDLEIYRRLLDRARRKGELCRALLEGAGGDLDLVFIVFGECHTGAHQFWRYRDGSGQPPLPGHQGELTHGIRDVYQAIDREIGETLKIFPADSDVFLVASVGLKSQWDTAGLNEKVLRSLGYQASHGEGKGSGSGGVSMSPMALLRRVLPQGVRDQLSRFLSRERQEQFISDKFRGATDWERTRAFSVPAYYSGQLRVNLRGREPAGIVEPGADYDALLDEIEGHLAGLVDPVTGEPAVLATRRTTELFGGGPPEVLPDLFVEWAEADHFMERVTWPGGEFTQSPCEFHRGSDHSQVGFIAASGPRVEARGDLGELSPLDLAPTLLRRLGVEPPAAMEGRPIRAMCGSAEPVEDEGA